jgi:hypothetical protein
MRPSRCSICEGKPEFLRRRRGGAFLAANLCGRCELILDAFGEAASAGLKELDGWRGRKGGTPA